MAQIVADNLKGKGYEVIQASDGDVALKLFIETSPALCILDIMMPLRDGYSVAQNIRRLHNGVPIIFLSAKSLDEDLVQGFKTGGNDYLRKPFSIIELIARVESLLTRFRVDNLKDKPDVVLTFGKCSLDTVSHHLKTSLKSYDLSFKEVMLLKMLIARKNNILPRHEALMEIWGDNTIYNANSMNVFMAHLRKMLKDDDSLQLMSIRGLGYKLICG